MMVLAGSTADTVGVCVTLVAFLAFIIILLRSV